MRILVFCTLEQKNNSLVFGVAIFVLYGFRSDRVSWILPLVPVARLNTKPQTEAERGHFQVARLPGLLTPLSHSCQTSYNCSSHMATASQLLRKFMCRRSTHFFLPLEVKLTVQPSHCISMCASRNKQPGIFFSPVNFKQRVKNMEEELHQVALALPSLFIRKNCWEDCLRLRLSLHTAVPSPSTRLL